MTGRAGTGAARPGLARLPATARLSRELVEDDLALIDALQGRIDRLDWEIHQRARSDPRVKVLTRLPGVGPFTAVVILAEVGDVGRFGSAQWPWPRGGAGRRGGRSRRGSVGHSTIA